jgi:hypothetical protein
MPAIILTPPDSVKCPALRVSCPQRSCSTIVLRKQGNALRVLDRDSVRLILGGDDDPTDRLLPEGKEVFHGYGGIQISPNEPEEGIGVARCWGYIAYFLLKKIPRGNGLMQICSSNQNLEVG